MRKQWEGSHFVNENERGSLFFGHEQFLSLPLKGTWNLLVEIHLPHPLLAPTVVEVLTELAAGLSDSPLLLGSWRRLDASDNSIWLLLLVRGYWNSSALWTLLEKTLGWTFDRWEVVLKVFWRQDAALFGSCGCAYWPAGGGKFVGGVGAGPGGWIYAPCWG